MNFKLFRIIEAEDTGLLMQPNLPWLGASPDRKVLDQSKVPSQGLLEIKCLYSKRDCDIHKLVRTDDFYIGLDKNKIRYLKKKHSLGYNTQIKIATDHARAEWCHFIVYVCNCLIIVRVKFD